MKGTWTSYDHDTGRRTVGWTSPARGLRPGCPTHDDEVSARVGGDRRTGAEQARSSGPSPSVLREHLTRLKIPYYLVRPESAGER